MRGGYDGDGVSELSSDADVLLADGEDTKPGVARVILPKALSMASFHSLSLRASSCALLELCCCKLCWIFCLAAAAPETASLNVLGLAPVREGVWGLGRGTAGAPASCPGSFPAIWSVTWIWFWA